MGACSSLPSASGHSVSIKSRQTEQRFISNDAFECALYATQGRRKRMEDKHVMTLQLPKHPSYSLFGVFDGFNGVDASTYFATNIAGALDRVDDLEDTDAIIAAIDEMDTCYIHSQHHNDNYNADAGCTFVFALIDCITDLSAVSASVLSRLHTPYSNSIYSSTATCSVTKRPSEDEFSSVFGMQHGFRVRVFWAGDSRAVLMADTNHNNHPFESLTVDHHVSAPQEAERILNAKGTISNNRIDGIVEVTRCFGCRAMKNDVSLPSNQQKMISVPECTTLICTHNDRLLLFCDGLTKKWTDSQFNTRCKHHVLQHEDETKGELNALKYLCEQAMDEGSNDNITVLSIKFK